MEGIKLNVKNVGVLLYANMGNSDINARHAGVLLSAFMRSDVINANNAWQCKLIQ